jgi:transposase-like protein/IS1 family transposase
MLCPVCSNESRPFGRNRNGSRRYRCDFCRRTFTDPQSRPADNRRLGLDRAVFVLRLILEGNSLRSANRLTGVARNTILATMVEAGEHCLTYLDSLRGLPAADVQGDELWAFVGMKERTRQRLGRGEEYGDVWCFLACERDTKLILAHHVGKRTPEDTMEFTEKLRRATRPGRFQFSTDGFTPYPGTVSAVFGTNIDYGQIVKVFGPTAETGTAGRYSPGQVTVVERWATIGTPDMDRVCTSHVERQNKTLRMQLRRYTRLTDGHSKKWENHEAAVALFVAYFNYCRVHMTLKTTPAVAAGVTDHVWSVAELLETVGVPR